MGESFQIAYRQARGRPEEEVAAFLALAARQLGRHEVAAAADRLSQGSPWSIRWIKRLSEPVIQHVAYHEGYVTALACARFGGRTLVVSAADRSKRLLVHDLETSDLLDTILLDTILLDHVGYNVTALAAFSLPSGLLVAAGDCDRRIQVFSADQHIGSSGGFRAAVTSVRSSPAYGTPDLRCGRHPACVHDATDFSLRCG